jgi:hypothetical protein
LTGEKGSKFPLRHGELDTQNAEFFVIGDDIGFIQCTFSMPFGASLLQRNWHGIGYKIHEILLLNVKHGGKLLTETAVSIF